uniref:PhoH-like protein n=1 Tax=viral metagenome TaxID=1070528 RepID=A0A6C0B1C7_9ZZZZ
MKRDNNMELKSLYHYYKPKSANQESYVKGLQDTDTKILFVVGPAGTGKTALACNQAIKELRNGNVNKIVITRPIVPVEEEEIGFLPGTIQKKMDPWTRPIFDIFYEFYAKKDVETMLYNNVIEISPLAFMRGRTFKNAFIIADEMQNSSPNQMLMLTTRIGEGSKMVITGDLKQSDRNVESGLSDFIERFKKYTGFLTKSGKESNVGIKIVELGVNDIERSKVIKKLLEIYDFNDEIVESKLQKSTSTIVKKVNKKEEKKEDTSVILLPAKIHPNNDAALITIDELLRSKR